MKRKNAEKPNSCLVAHDDLSDISESEDSYEAKVSDIERQIKQLDDKVHPEYLKAKRKIDSWYLDEKQRVQILHDYRLETVDLEYKKEYEACDQDCELEKRRIQDYLTSLCEELKRRLEQDKKNIELTPSGDILEFKPAITRKLRRRAGSEAPSAHANNFVYWGDLLLCGSAWPLNTVPCKGALTSLDTVSMTDVKSPAADGTASSDANTNAAGLDASDSTRPVSTSTASDLPVTTSTGPTNLGISSNSATKSNFFGSLGVNLFDGSLLAHLLTSINSSGCGGSNGGPGVAGNTSAAGSVGCVGLTGSSVTAGIANLASLTGAAALSNYLHGSTASSAAVAASLILPPNSGLVASVAAGITASPIIAAPPSTGKKRRQQNAAPTAQLNLLLPENDIYADLTVIRRACAKLAGMSNANTPGSARKHHATGHSNNSTLSGHNLHSPPHNADGLGWTGAGKPHRSDTVPGGGSGGSNGTTTTGSAISSPNPAGFGCSSWEHQLTTPSRLQSGGSIAPSASPGSGPCVWIDDGRLYCGQKCYQYGASVILEGRDGANQRCTGTITAIGAQDVAIRRSSDHGICRVTVQQLKQGRYTLWPAKIT